MIGKPEWFTYRKFGWGIAPKSWQGWAYLGTVALLLGFTTAIGINNAIMPWLFGAIITLLVLDVIHIMTKLPQVHDERENIHQLIIERNCSFAAIVALLAVALFQTYQNRGTILSNAATGVSPGIPFDISILIVLGAMLLTKIASTLYVSKKM